MKILIIKLRNIGDVLLVTPVINNLKNYFPASNIDILLNKGTEEMISLNPNVNQIYIYDRESSIQKNFYRRTFHELKFFLSFKRKKYDIVINLTEGDRGAFITKIIKPRTSLGYKNKNRLLSSVYTKNLPKQGLRHTIDANLDALRLLDIPILSKKVDIFSTPEDDKFIAKKINSVTNFVHIHPVSRWLFKCVSNSTMANIIDFIEHELQIRVILTAAPVKNEIKKVKSICSLVKAKPIDLSGQLTLKQIVALNKRANLFIGVDTAIMHISAANDTPVLSFFGPSGAHHWGPWDNELMKSTYSKVNGFQLMGKHRVISENRICQPCGKDGCNGSKVSDCLMDMDLEKIKDTIREMINGR